jgi:hypothetical protein
MDQTYFRRFALDQVANEVAVDGHAKAVRAVKLPVADSLREAKAILTEALCHNPQHDDACEARRFAEHNSYLPPSHPAWKSAPQCDCWVSRLASFLKSDQLES